MNFPRFPLFAAVAVMVLLLTACDPNPTPEEACVQGSNGANPVIIVPGTFSPAIANQLFLGNSIAAAGYTYCVLELKGDEAVGNLPGTMNMIISSIALRLFVDDVLEWASASKVSLVGHSQGALVARAYIKAFGGDQQVDKMISLAGPNSGTEVAALVEHFIEPVLSPFGITCESVAPCEQMQIGSEFITELNAGDMTPGNVDYYAFYTNNDELVWYWGTGPFGFPAIKFDNATLGPGATNVEIGEVCPLRVVGHLGMIVDPVPIHMTLDALAGNSIHVPFGLCLLPPVII